MGQLVLNTLTGYAYIKTYIHSIFHSLKVSSSFYTYVL